MVGHHKFCGNMTVAITAPLRPMMKSSDTPTATPLRKRGESGAGNHSLWSRQCGVWQTWAMFVVTRVRHAPSVRR